MRIVEKARTEKWTNIYIYLDLFGIKNKLSLIIKPERELWVTGSWQLKLSRVVFPSISLLSKSRPISDTISGAQLPKLSQHLHTGVLEQFVRSLELPRRKLYKGRKRGTARDDKMNFYLRLRRNLSAPSIKMWLQRYDRWQHWEIFRSPQIRCIVQRLVSPSGDHIVLMIVNTVGITMGGRQVIYKKPEPGHDIGQIRASRMLALMRREWRGEDDSRIVTHPVSASPCHHNDTQHKTWYRHKNVCFLTKKAFDQGFDDDIHNNKVWAMTLSESLSELTIN